VAQDHKERFHPTQKPIKLYEWILSNYAEKGQRILDTHLGSGSSRIAADKYGMDFTGFEVNETYYNLSEKRFMQYKSQPSLFEVW
jgi:site-specific DNA-methyltransferase (adenine-specific)